jgi:hypothetical protein
LSAQAAERTSSFSVEKCMKFDEFLKRKVQDSKNDLYKRLQKKRASKQQQPQRATAKG